MNTHMSATEGGNAQARGWFPCFAAPAYDDIDDPLASPALRRQYLLDLVGFWVCGLINNFAYVIMLSAAVDLLEDVDNVPTSAILLADIVPTMCIKLTAPFFMHSIPYRIRVVFIIFMAVSSFHIVAWNKHIGVRLFGVVCASISAGTGEITFLSMSSWYHKNTVSAWSSGTGGAGVFGALMYLACTAWIGLSSQVTLVIASFLPLCSLVCFFGLMSHPFKKKVREGDEAERALTTAAAPTDGRMVEELDMDEVVETDAVLGALPDELTTMERIMTLKPLLKYMIPLVIVYYFEYLINQSVVTVITYDQPFDRPQDYYVYYQFLYQGGVFISRSSVNFFPIKRVWIPAVLQAVNFVILSCHVLIWFIPSVYIVFAIIVWEGLLGGAVYVNAFYLISIEITPGLREFSLGVASVADSSGITASALTGLWLEPFLMRNAAKPRLLK